MKVINQYIERIRNPHKRSYARAYWNWLASDSCEPEPEKPAELSYMAAQSVRVALVELMQQEKIKC